MYLCHSEILMPKDTESLGNNKAPACESRGFVRKIMKVCILTHLHDAGLGNTEKVSVCDLWHQKDLGEYKGEFWAQVP